MKQKLQNLFFLFLLGTIGVKAQGPVITAAGFNPQIGDSYTAQFVLSNSINLSDTGGINRIWDYTNLQDSPFVFTYNFVSPLGLLGSDSFPQASFAQKSSIDTSSLGYSYYQTNDKSFKILGNCDSWSGNVIYNKYIPGKTEMNYPTSYKDVFTDSISSYSNGWFSNIFLDSTYADGYGTLKLPNGTYQNVLRLKTTETIKDPTSGSIIGYSESYVYVTNGIHFPLLEIDNSFNGNGLQAFYYKKTTLPLQISSFTISWQNKMPYLQWEAANTENTKQFNIQRSADGHSFGTVGQVGVSGGASYHFEDNYIPSSTVYYRLQQVDKNGQTFYSAMARLTVNGQPLTVYPNPAKGTIHVSVPNGNAVYVMIYDAIGRLVYENKNYSSAQPITTDSWSKGTYLVKVKDNEGWKVSSFVKE